MIRTVHVIALHHCFITSESLICEALGLTLRVQGRRSGPMATTPAAAGGLRGLPIRAGVALMGAIDTKVNGTEMPEVRAGIEHRWLRSWAPAIGETDPIYDVDAARAAGHSGLPVSPVFLFSLVLGRAGLIVLDGAGHVPMTHEPEAIARLSTAVTTSVDRLHAIGAA